MFKNIFEKTSVILNLNRLDDGVDCRRFITPALDFYEKISYIEPEIKIGGDWLSTGTWGLQASGRARVTL